MINNCINSQSLCCLIKQHFIKNKQNITICDLLNEDFCKRNDVKQLCNICIIDLNKCFNFKSLLINNSLCDEYIKDYITIIKDNHSYNYIDYNKRLHRLNGPAKQFYNGNCWYYICGIHYMSLFKINNDEYILYITKDISIIDEKYFSFIKNEYNKIRNFRFYIKI